VAPKSIDPHNPTLILVAAFSTLSLVLGFAYGNEWAREGFHLKDWQPLLAAFVAAVGVIAAWMMARRTLRFNAISREENRIEEGLPGLREATAWLSQVLSALRGLRNQEETSRTLNLFRIGRPGTSIEAEVAEAIPLADATTQQRIAQAFLNFYAVAKRLDSVVDDIAAAREVLRGNPASIRAQVDVFTTNMTAAQQRGSILGELDNAFAELSSLHNELETRRTTFEARLARLRTEIERYLGDH